MENSKAILTPNPALPNHMIKIDPEKCVACYQCAQVCRCNVLFENPEPGQPPLLVYPDECWHCAACTENCPTGAIEFDHPINQKITWKRKDTGEMFRIGMKNPPPPYTKKAYGDRNVYLEKVEKIALKVLEVEKVARFVVRVRLGKTDKAIPLYRVGSFCNIKIENEKYRGYSISNVYNGEYIELFIDIFGKGQGANFFAALENGKIVEAAMPYGRFLYTPKSTSLLLIGSVTGISPIKGILEQELLIEKGNRKIHMVFQVWEKEDIFLLDYFEEMAKKYSNFSYKILYGNVNAYAGASEGVRMDEYLRTSEFVNSEIDAYICGSKVLIKAIERVLYDRGVFWRNIFYESFLA